MAFFTGLLGAGHCIGMCGSLVTALSLSEAGRQGGWFFQLLYNIGRISTYTFIGAVVGWLGSALAYTDRFKMVTRSLLIGSDFFVILVGLGTAGLFKLAFVVYLRQFLHSPWDFSSVLSPVAISMRWRLQPLKAQVLRPVL
jgi:sulfite exporter TauE/SafE